jgi:deferrochelatase/peroxidase EfeB
MAKAPRRLIDNPDPVVFPKGHHDALLERLQGNILKGHGRDYAVNLFLHFKAGARPSAVRAEVKRLARTYVTSAACQLEESLEYRRSGLPGGLFGNLFLSRSGYVKLGNGERTLTRWFADRADKAYPAHTSFLTGMKGASDELGDNVTEPHEPLETAYLDGTIDALLLLADDSKEYLDRTARREVITLQENGIADVVAIERGAALRNPQGHGIEHFGYVDGRSQPLFFASDFEGLVKGKIDADTTAERLPGGGRGSLKDWNSFAPLSLVLRKDPGVADPDAYGSYYVFRKLEQNVQGFAIAEVELAKALGLPEDARQRAGAMVVGRFRDGSPLVLSGSESKDRNPSNDYRYDADPFGLKCPFHAHIRKVSPRLAGTEQRRIARRGITYGSRDVVDWSRGLEGFPTGGVGLLFACFQSSIVNQFAFIHARWANNPIFQVMGLSTRMSGRDAMLCPRPENGQHWRPEYGGCPGDPAPTNLMDLDVQTSHPNRFSFGGFVKFRGGEFFFAPSLPFLYRL